MDAIEEALVSAAKSRHRRLFVVSGDWKKSMKVVGKILKTAKKYVGKDLVYFAEFPKDSDIGERRFKEFTRQISGQGYLVQKKAFAMAPSVLGKTFDVLVIEAYENFPPRDMGIIVETVRGPGVIILLIPEINKWVSSKMFYHENSVVTPPYSVKDCRDVFLNRVAKKIFEHDGIYVLSDTGEIVKAPKTDEAPKKRGKIKIPVESILPDAVYKLAATQDQVDALEILETVVKSKKKAYVLLADRGRGKSAVIGLTIGGIIGTKKWKIVVTAPSFENATQVFDFIKRSLDALGAEYSEKRGKISVKGGGEAVFMEPLDAVDSKADILFVDEAAGIYVSVLKDIIRRYKRVVFATTTHGYEGTGRLFQYKFLPLLQSKFEVEQLRMSEPIRYGEGDPIEKWLYDVFLFDAEPVDLDEEDIQAVERGELLFEELDVRKMFLEDEDTLRQFVGIYVFAHYRNNPRDIAILADAPNQRAFAVKTPSGKIVCSLQVAEEGGLPKAVIDRMKDREVIQGNILPDLMIKYYGYEAFARSKGARVVRIATHPDLQGKGIGSYALERLAAHVSGEGFHWLGAVFGASPELLNFWEKNGFTPIHVSPKRNPESGEYSTAVLKPLVDSVAPLISLANRGIKLRVAYELDNFYRNMEPTVAIRLLSHGEPISYEPMVLDADERKLKRFLEGGLHYDAVSDVVYRLVIHYFVTGANEPPMDEKDKAYLVEKVLKKRTWKGVGDVFNRDPMKVARRIDRILYGLIRWYLGEI